MGHANFSNLSRFVNRMLHSGTPTIKEILNLMVERRMKMHASEGDYAEREMLGMAVDEILGFLVDEGAIEPILPTVKKRKVFRQWQNMENDEWEDEQYQVFDDIKWRSKAKRLPILGNHTS